MNRTPIIHTLRKALGMLGSREEVALYLDVSPDLVSKWLRTDDIPTPRLYLELLALIESGRRQLRADRQAAMRSSEARKGLLST